MIEYIYFVKCPGCEDEHFDFFNDAKEFALGCLSQKPVITQIEVNRNDFGECVDSCDLGTVWSWEEIMKDVPAEPELTTFSKAETLECDQCTDPEFDSLDNSLDSVPDNFRKPIKEDCDWVYAPEGQRFTKEELYDELINKSNVLVINLGDCESDPLSVRFSDYSRYSDTELQIHFEAYDNKFVAVEWHNSDDGDQTEGDYYVEFDTFDELWEELTGNYYAFVEASTGVADVRKPVPADMTVEDLVEEMEENEDEVECTWCEEIFDKSECRKEVNLGWLCDRCQAAIMSRGEPLTFRENNYWDFLDESVVDSLKEAFDPNAEVEFEYKDLEITLFGNQRDADDWDELQHTDDFTYTRTKEDVATDIWENFITEEDVKEVPGGLEALEDDDKWEAFLGAHFDTLLAKYYDKLMEYYREDAVEAFQDSYSWDDMIADREANMIDRAYDEARDAKYFGESKQKSFLEEFDDETHKANLTDCPECGTASYDMKEQYCTNCGLNL